MSVRQRRIGWRIFCQIYTHINRPTGHLMRAMKKTPYICLMVVALTVMSLVFSQVVLGWGLKKASIVMPVAPISRAVWGLYGTGKYDSGSTVAVTGSKASPSDPNPSVALSVPVNLTAPVTASNQVQLQWGSSTGASYYQVERRLNVTQDYQVISTPASTVFTDTNVMDGVSYLYRVRAVDSAGNLSPPSSTRLATAVTFTDNPLSDPQNPSNTVRITKAHIIQLRNAVNAVRAVAGKANATWTYNLDVDPRIHAKDIEELRSNVNEALQAIFMGTPLPTYTDNTTAGLLGVQIKREHIQELRDAVNWGGTENSPPTVKITSPANNSTFTLGTNIQISADASDADGSVSKVEFFQGGTKLGEALAAPYSITWNNVSAGNYSLTARAIDNNGAAVTSSINITVGSDFSASRLDPDNAPGQAGEDLLSRNFNLSLPLVSLPGRAGLDLNIFLSYNSLVWTKDASGKNIKYDVDQGFPAPGFRLGFPVIEQKYYSSQTGKYSYLMIMPSGARVELRQIGTSTYEAADSSYLQLTEGDGLTVRTTSGTQLRYFLIGTLYQCTEIKDRNGNFISIGYRDDGLISSTTDTAGRTVSFNYDTSGHLSSITQQWVEVTVSIDGTKNKTTKTKTLVNFSYSAKTIQTGFSGISVIGPANGSQLSVLTGVSYADDSSYEFSYNDWGQIYQIHKRAPDGHELARTTYTMDTPTQDCPRFTERRDYAENWNDGREAVTTFSVPKEVTRTMPDNEGEVFTGRVCEVKSPDNTTTKVYYPSSGWGKGLAILTETIADSITRRWVRTKWTQDNEALSFEQNPRIKETIIGDPEGNRKRTTITYQNFALPEGSNCYLPVDVAEGNANTILRHAKTSYNMDTAYTSRRIIGLTDTVQLFEGESLLLSKMSYAYDEAGYLAEQTNVIQHDDSYGTGFVAGRGNLTGERRWDVNHSDQVSFSVISHMGYNTAGSIVSTTDPSNHTATISYADVYTGPGVVPNTFTYPTEVKDPAGFASTLTYDYLSGSVTRTRNPLGAEVVLSYDSVGRLTRRTIRDAVADKDVTYTRVEYFTNGTELRTYSLIDVVNGAKVESFSLQRFDGGGHIIGSASSHPGSMSGYRGVRVLYDVMGRVSAQTNPAEIADPKGVEVSNWAVSGDDALVGWQWNHQAYDWKGRPTVLTNIDTSQRTVSYDGCGCAGSAITTATDEMGRIQKSYADEFGRVTKVEALNTDGTVYASTLNVYNGRDQLTFVREYKGAATPDGSCPVDVCQETVLTYDGHGRLYTAKRPEQTKPTRYSYNPDDTLDVVEDARGVTQTLSYDQRHLVKKIVYGVPIDPATGVPYSNIPATPTVEFTYDAAGNRRSMSDGLGWADYIYNTLSQMTSEKRYFSEIGGTNPNAKRIFELTYEYNLAGGLKSITDPSNYKIKYDYDNAGQLQSVTGDSPFANVSQYVSNLKYVAGGSARAASYGDGTSVTLSYDQRGRISHYALTGARDIQNQAQPEGGDYQYYADGRLKLFSELSDTRTGGSFDRVYTYDHVGRISEAYSGTEARDFLNGTTSYYPGTKLRILDGPYRQTYNYDAFGHLTNRTGRYWSQEDNLAEEYDAATARNKQWTYDAEGNLLSTNEPPFNSFEFNSAQHTFDAAGQHTHLSQTTSRLSPDQSTVRTTTVDKTDTYDGDGVGARQVVVTTFKSNPPGPATDYSENETTYYVRSSVLGNRTISEYNGDAVKIQSYVWAGGEVVARQVGEGTSTRIEWQHMDPVTGDQVTTGTGGLVSTTTRVDPSGIDVGMRDPFTDPNADATPQELARRGQPILFSFNGGPKCSIDGFMADCGLVSTVLSSGAGAVCTNNNCGPRIRTTTMKFGGITITQRYVTSSFRAYANGAQGFWIGSIGTPETPVFTREGIIWFGNNGEGLVPDGYNNVLTGDAAGAVAVAANITAYDSPDGDTKKPPITYEEWMRIQREIDKIIFPIFESRRNFTENQIRRIKELVEQREGREIIYPRQFKMAERWIECATPIHNDFLRKRRSWIDSWNNKAIVGLWVAAVGIVGSLPERPVTLPALPDVSVGTGALKGAGAGAGAAYNLSTNDLNNQLMRSLVEEQDERQSKCGAWPGPGPVPAFQAW